MSKNFSYPHTCPQIDKNIKEFQSTLSQNLSSLVADLNPPFFATKEGVNFIEEWVDILYSSAEPCFEDTRKANSDMRDEVEKVLDDIIEDRDEYKRLAELWESEADEKDKEIEDLEQRLNDR